MSLPPTRITSSAWWYVRFGLSMVSLIHLNCFHVLNSFQCRAITARDPSYAVPVIPHIPVKIRHTSVGASSRSRCQSRFIRHTGLDRFPNLFCEPGEIP
ncbi:hypothetical protein JAAARDRAFT_57454 [Jaapia argillacea MUCL 33604]|uniref:Uncharacterized protein n=1 Tax=Jaapia argillacea MUCL 33604 TaxID=933084 RepID=A0A067Q7F3_9AGAM|nr:hypothetical protein JAAARDRAFT_57454 [Jaapia argillacea MUCL 33604]